MIALMEKLKVIGFVAIGLVAIIGTLTITGFFTFLFQKNQLEQEEKSLLAKISQQSKKEGLLVSLKQRLPVVEKIIAAQAPWERVIDVISSIAQPPVLTTIEAADKSVIKLTLKASSLEEASAIVIKLIDLTNQNKIKSPQLLGLNLLKDGLIQMSVSFVPVFN